jgi:hypothetical protein
MTARAAVARQSHDHQFGEVLERDRHDTVFGEAAVRGTRGRQTWVAGLAIERDAYTARDVPRFDYTFTVPGAFAQYNVGRWLFLRDAGRKLSHLDRQLRSRDAVLQGLHRDLKM